MVISQGDIYWIDMDEPRGSGPGYRHPFVVIQNDAFNRSRINTLVVCALTSNLRLASAPGNVPLAKGAGNLPKASVVNVSQVMTVDKSDLGDKIGHLPKKKVEEIFAGFELLLKPHPA